MHNFENMWKFTRRVTPQNGTAALPGFALLTEQASTEYARLVLCQDTVTPRRRAAASEYLNTDKQF